MIYAEMKKSLDLAESNKNKTAMLHYLILKNADKLANDNPTEICKFLNIKPSFATEIRKMIALHHLMRKHNLVL